MERLTKIIDLHNTLPLSMVDIETKTDEPCVYGLAVDVLAAYEDSELAPGQVQRLQQENSNLKRLLKLAVEDIRTAMEFVNNSPCRVCAHYYRCKCDGICMIRDELRKWRYADEAKELIKNDNGILD